MLRTLALIGVLATACLSGPEAAQSADLLRVEGNIVKWPAPSTATTTVISYAILERPHLVARNTKTLSPDNCGSMLPFSDIVAGSSGVSDRSSRSELRSALTAWERIANVKFVEVREPSLAHIVVGATETRGGPAFANISLRKGQQEGGSAQQPKDKALGGASDDAPPRSAVFSESGKVALIERAYVCLNAKMRWKIGFDGNLAIYDLRHTFIHEIGHAIGLDHPGRSGSIMGFRYDESVREPQLLDSMAAQRLYGPPATNN